MIEGMDREFWNRRYAGSELVWTADANRFLVAEIADLKPGRALDLACGEGRNAVWLAERGWEVTAVDFSDVGLAKAAKLASARGVDVEWVQADLLDFVPAPGAFDLVALLYFHVLAAERRAIHARAAAAVAAGGVLLVVGHDSSNIADGYGGPQDPAILFTPDEVAAELPGLRIERGERVRRPVASPEGEAHAIDALVRATRDGESVGARPRR
jgi:SAM-dependent methyltransferase